MRIGPLSFTAARGARARWDELSHPGRPGGGPALVRLVAITAILVGGIVFWLVVTALSR